jgi:hypothetical protein
VGIAGLVGVLILPDDGMGDEFSLDVLIRDGIVGIKWFGRSAVGDCVEARSSMSSSSSYADDVLLVVRRC